jgi:RecJ-like exonuclease
MEKLRIRTRKDNVMSDDYEITGIIVKKKESNDGCAGCLGALFLIAILGACFESCFGNGDKSRTSLESKENATPIVQQSANPPSPQLRRIRCRACGGDGKVTVAPVGPTCNGQRKVVDQERTAQNASRDIARSIRRKRVPQPKTYYKNCPFCHERGRTRQVDNCRDCGGSGSLIQR